MYSVIADILFISLASASVSNFFDDCIGEGMIFERWGNYTKDKFWLKPLGGCIICTNFWITILMAISYVYFADAFYLFAIIGLSNTALKFIIK